MYAHIAKVRHTDSHVMFMMVVGGDGGSGHWKWLWQCMVVVSGWCVHSVGAGRTCPVHKSIRLHALIDV